MYVAPDQLQRIFGELRAIRAEQAAQFASHAAEIQALRRQLVGGMSRPAGEDAARRITALERRFGGREFTSPEVLAAALENTPEGAALAGLFGHCTPKKIGTRLSRCQGLATAEGVVLTKAGQVGDVSSWRCLRA